MLEDDVRLEPKTAFGGVLALQAGIGGENQSGKEQLLNKWPFKRREYIGGSWTPNKELCSRTSRVPFRSFAIK